MIEILFSAPENYGGKYIPPIREALDSLGLAHRIETECGDPARVDYIICAPNGPVTDFSPFTRARAVLSLWAGVERFVHNPTLTQPLLRMVNPGMTAGMVEYVTGHVLRHHLGMDTHIRREKPEWQPEIPPLASERRVSVLGLGALGQASAQALAGLGFDVAGWSRSPKSIEGIRCLSGTSGLEEALGRAEILVLLLPLTDETENILDAARLALLPEGAAIINPGRGPLIDDDALLAALDREHLAHATLDVFRTEPLPESHPFWHHPKITVTPHIASDTRPAQAARVIAENIRRGEAGEPFLHQVDRSAGY